VSAFATALTDCGSCFLVRQVPRGGAIGKLPLLRYVFELR
jgi:hypothetical protein